jgi:hypothetical protein
MIYNIRDSPQSVCAKTNGGQQISTHVGDFTNLGVVWYNQDSIANILSLAQVRKVCKVTMNTAVDPALVVHHKDSSTMRFQEHTDGLYYYDTHVHVTPDPDNSRTSPITLVNTVSANNSYSRD